MFIFILRALLKMKINKSLHKCQVQNSNTQWARAAQYNPYKTTKNFRNDNSVECWKRSLLICIYRLYLEFYSCRIQLMAVYRNYVPSHRVDFFSNTRFLFVCSFTFQCLLMPQHNPISNSMRRSTTLFAIEKFNVCVSIAIFVYKVQSAVMLLTEHRCYDQTST